MGIDRHQVDLCDFSIMCREEQLSILRQKNKERKNKEKESTHLKLKSGGKAASWNTKELECPFDWFSLHFFLPPFFQPLTVRQGLSA